MLVVHSVAAAAVGLALRFAFVWLFPYYESGDTPLYEAMAWNWLAHGVFGMRVGGRVEPVDIRAPGYPAFLAAVYSVSGLSAIPVMAAQAIVDVATCFVVMGIAAAIAPPPWRRRAALTGLWLAVLCPFTANYTATILSETLATFFNAGALLLLVAGETRSSLFAAGLVSGVGALVRPETPLVLAAKASLLAARRHWRELAVAVTAMAIGLLIPLAPWTLRNWVEIHRFDPLARRYADLPIELPPRGFYAWTSTWLWRLEDVEGVVWKLVESPMNGGDVPAAAFDSNEERERVGALIEAFQRTRQTTAEVDEGFAEIARERTARDPLRTWLRVPALRAVALWATPRVEIVPAAEGLLPIGERWDKDPEGYALLAGFSLLEIVYVAVALAGAWAAWQSPGARLLATFIVVRTAFIAWYALTPEPRYVLECFPAVIALGAQVGYLRRRRSS
jgi:hypothetical protein